MNITAFTTSLATIPFAPTRTEAQGILAPLIRASGHLLFLLAHLGEQETSDHTPLTAEEEMNELTHAAEHLTTTNLPDELPTLSAATRAHITTFRLGVINIRVNWIDWTHDNRLTALRDLTNRAAALGAILDRELTGIPANLIDPGSSF